MRKFLSYFFIGGVMPVIAAPYGSFSSPISAEWIAKGSVHMKHLLVDEEEMYWIEGRPQEKGRDIPVKYSTRKDLLPAEYSVKTTLHEYGGKCFCVHDGTFYFSNYPEQNLYKCSQEGSITRITNENSLRFADFSIHPNGKWLYSVVEDHNNESVKNSIVKIHLETGNLETIAAGHDFYAAPRISPDGMRIAYIFWDHPNMPWDKTELWLGDLNQDGLIESEKKISGLENESILEPSWSPSGMLYFVSDRNGYWNLYNEENEPICEMNADFTSPLWYLGEKNYTFVLVDNKPHIAAIYTEKAIDFLALIDIEKRSLKKIPLEFNALSNINTRKQTIVFFARSSTELSQLVEFDPTSNEINVLVAPEPLNIEPSFFSSPEVIEYPSLNGKHAFAFFYPPKNPNFTGNKDEKPPLIVFTHGGPTAHTSPSLKLSIQYWTSRGFAVCDVNYSGSTGYGREYRDRLKGEWGVVDVYDVCSAANYLVEKGLVDPNRLAIEGGSAGGYTTLAALTFSNTFKVGASYFGVSDLSLLAQETHKFEAHYLDTLIGPYPAKEALYKERSPLVHADNLSCPVLFLQGGMDKIVLPNQAEKMYDILLKKKIPTAYLLFEDEAHGFRKAPNIIAAMEAELYFYRRIFKIPSTEKAPSLQIVNLDR